MEFCSQCALSEKFPGISFNEEGACNYCTNNTVPDDEKKDEYYKKFEELLDLHRGKHQFDVIMAYSGGKDSTHTLLTLAKQQKMRVLAWTFDNGFLSDQARKNILHMTDVMGATSMIVRPPFGILKQAFTAAATKDIYSPKTLDRASSICTTCIGFVKSMVLKTALQMEIPLAAYGWSPGQAPITSAIMQTNPRMQRFSNKGVRDPLLAATGDELAQYFLTEEDLAIPKEKWPINIHPLAFTVYNEEEIIKEIAAEGWEKPSDTDANSTNCTLNALANHLHRERFGFHPYAWEIAGIVRSGQMDRDDGIKKTNQDEDMGMVKYAADLLEIKVD
ncbi:MAG: hypothetical protein GY754_46440 [bacterium]|nr:hypothetical protein [bacterium]